MTREPISPTTRIILLFSFALFIALAASTSVSEPLRASGSGGANVDAPELVAQQSPGTLYLPIITADAPPASLLENGDFESGTLEGWEYGAGGEVSTEYAHGGQYSACMTDASLRSEWIDVRPGVTYKVTTWVRIVSEESIGGDLWGGFNVRINDDDWRTLVQSDYLLQGTHGSEWRKIALSFVPTTSRVLVDIGYFGGSGRHMFACVDDVALFRKLANRPPRIAASLTPVSGLSRSTVQQFSLAGDDPDGAIERVLWDFGDGTRALSSDGERIAALAGVFTATVRVADDEGAITTQVVRWEVDDPEAPSVTITTPFAAASVDTRVLELRGETTGSITKVFVSTDHDVGVQADGTATWQADLPLDPGDNRILVQAHNGEGQIATTERLVRYVPAAPLRIDDVEYSGSVERWEPIEVTFALQNSAATHPHLPFDASPPPGLEWVDGASVDARFSPDGWQTVYTRPAFLQQRYVRAMKDGREWLYPTGEPVWTARFAPPSEGEWAFRLYAREDRGAVLSGVFTFTVSAPTNPANHGMLRVAEQDTRYFEFEDGSPFYGAGHGVGFSAEQFSYAASQLFDEMGAGNQNFLRWWLSGLIWASAWQPWNSRTLDADGYIPATGLSLDRAYGDGLASIRLDSDNPIMFYGFASGWPGLIPGHTYRLRVRWRTEGIVAPVISGAPYGVTLKFTGWPEVGDTGRFPALVPHVNGDTPWHVAEADFAADTDFLSEYLVLVFENARQGAAYVDSITLQEVQPDGSLGAQLLRTPRVNSHLTFDERRAAGIDAILADANVRGLYFKLVISEKNEWLLNHLGPDGLPDLLGGNFNAVPRSPGRWLHEAYWRYLGARYGAYRAVHSWELVNEAAPGYGDHFRLAAALAEYAAKDGNPHLATTSTWATLAEDVWAHPDLAAIGYVDFHAYVNGTGWIEPKAELSEDSARFFAEYDAAALAAGFGKPVVWGEMGIDGTATTDEQDELLTEDVTGVWLHKLTWARLGPGGVYPLYWYTDNIYENRLHTIFGAWRRFMEDIPLANGRYVDADASTSTPGLRVFGQKDMEAGRAHLWIDNRQHTWMNVVDGIEAPRAEGLVTVAMGAPGAVYRATWYDTHTGEPASTLSAVADGSGRVALRVNDLETDIAVKFERLSR